MASEEQDEIELADTVKDLKQHVQSVIDAVGGDLETVAIAFKQHQSTIQSRQSVVLYAHQQELSWEHSEL